MRRRRFLATASTALPVALSGCLGSVGGPTSLGPPEEQVDDEGSETHLVYSRDDTEQATISLVQRTLPDGPMDRFGLRLHVWHREGLSIDSMRYELRMPTKPGAFPADVHLKRPDGGPWPAFTFDGIDGATVVAVDGLGDLGDGSLTLDLLVRPVSDPVEEVSLNAAVEFSETGALARHYRASATTRHTVVRE